MHINTHTNINHINKSLTTNTPSKEGAGFFA